MTVWQKALITVSIVAAVVTAVALVKAPDDKNTPIGTPAKPALTVTTLKPQRVALAATFAATGNIMAWQEAIIGAQVDGLRLNEVRVNVGDPINAGQVLATFAPETLEAELAQSRANVAEAEATLTEAQANAERTKLLGAKGALSMQQIQQYLTVAKTAEARLAVARAMLQASSMRVAHTQVLAPDSGTISARAATLGAVVMNGQELFRMVRKDRLEWRAEVTAAELSRIWVGQKVAVITSGITPAGARVAGKVRVIAPTVDPQTRNVQVYVDLAPGTAAKAGMFARGEFALDTSPGLTVPRQAVVVRDGFSYVFVVRPDQRVTQQKVTVGRRLADHIELIEGVSQDTLLVAQGAGFLNDGDLVKVTAVATTTSPNMTGARRAP